jgi:hypothetical protein
MADFLKRNTKTSQGTSVQYALFTFQFWPQYTVQTFNSLHAASISAQHGVNAFTGTKTLKHLQPEQ